MSASILPTWVAVELRDELAVCRCVRPSGAQAYARGGYRHCRGAGVVSRPAVEVLHVATPRVAEARA